MWKMIGWQNSICICICICICEICSSPPLQPGARGANRCKMTGPGMAEQSLPVSLAGTRLVNCSRKQTSCRWKRLNSRRNCEQATKQRNKQAKNQTTQQGDNERASTQGIANKQTSKKQANKVPMKEPQFKEEGKRKEKAQLKEL